MLVMKRFGDYVKGLKGVDAYLTRHVYEIGSVPIAAHGIYSLIERDYVLGVAELLVSAGGFYMGFRNWNSRKKARKKTDRIPRKEITPKEELLHELSETGKMN